jgi:NADPH:quinone reductase
MKAIRFHACGGPEVLRLEEIPVPEVQPGEVLIRVQAAGVNFLDAYQRTGLYKTPLPFVPGMEGAGFIEKSEPEARLKPGTRVAWAEHPGAYAQFAAIPAWKVVELPEEVDARTGAAALLQGMTAEYLCETTYPARAGDVALVHAGAGGVGLLLIQLLKQTGVTVYTTVSTPEKAALVREAGADEAILYTEVDFVETVRSFTKGNGVHVVYDSVGKTTYEGSLNVLRPFGMLVLFGQSGGPVPPIDPLLLSQKGSLFLTWPSLAHHVADAASFNNRATKVLNWVAQKSLKLRIERIYPLAEVAKAQEDLESRRTTGKLVVEIN